MHKRLISFINLSKTSKTQNQTPFHKRILSSTTPHLNNNTSNNQNSQSSFKLPTSNSKDKISFLSTQSSVFINPTLKQKVLSLIKGYKIQQEYQKSQKLKFLKSKTKNKSSTKINSSHKKNKVQLSVINLYNKQNQIHIVSKIYKEIITSRRSPSSKIDKDRNTTSSKMVKKFNSKSQNVLHNLSMSKIPNKTNMDVFHLTQPSALNKYFIRDFGLKLCNQEIEYSNKKHELTEGFFEKRNSIFQKRASQISKNFDMLKKKEINLSNYNYNETNYDHIMGEEDLFKKITENEYKINKLRYDKKINEKIEQNSKNFVDLIEGLNTTKYEKVKHRNAKMEVLDINYNNLGRKIKVNYIQRNNVDMDDEERTTAQKFQKLQRETDEEILFAMKKIGPPAFVKKKFKRKTLEIFRMVNGDFMGIPV